MYVRGKYKFICCCLLLICFTTACTKQNGDTQNMAAEEAVSSLEPAESQETEEFIEEELAERRNEELESYTAEDYKNAYDTRKKTFSGDEDTKLYLLEEFDEIKLYMSKEPWNLVVADGEDNYIFDISCISSHGILPEFLYKDIDEDGEKEIVVDSLLGVGTGASVDYLYVLDRDEDGEFVDKQFTSEELIAQMEEHFSYTYDEEKEEVQYYLDGQPVGDAFSIFCEYDKSEFQDDYTFEGVHMFNFIGYTLENNEIEVAVDLEGRMEEWPGCPIFINACMEANVRYSSEGNFSLSNVQLEFTENE